MSTYVSEERTSYVFSALSAYCCCLCWLIFRLWRWRLYLPAKHQGTFSKLHSITNQSSHSVHVDCLYLTAHTWNHSPSLRKTAEERSLLPVTYLLTYLNMLNYFNKKKLHGLNPRTNYTDRATAACRRSDCQLLRIKGATWSAWRIPTAVFSVF
jgi:hypothetical protein